MGSGEAKVIDTLKHLNIEFVSFRENLDTGGPLGRGGTGQSGMTLAKVAETHKISRALVSRILKEERQKGSLQTPSQATENTTAVSAACDPTKLRVERGTFAPIR